MTKHLAQSLIIFRVKFTHVPICRVVVCGKVLRGNLRDRDILHDIWHDELTVISAVLFPTVVQTRSANVEIMNLDAFLELENTGRPKTWLESLHFEAEKISKHDDRQPEKRTSTHECNSLLESTVPVFF